MKPKVPTRAPDRGPRPSAPPCGRESAAALADFARLAAHACDAERALVVLMCDPAPECAAQCGFGAEGAPPQGGPFDPLLLRAGALVVSDARRDERFAAYPPVAAGAIQLVAGAPMRDRDGAVVGALWILDGARRLLAAPQLEALESIANRALERLEIAHALDDARRGAAAPDPELPRLRALVEHQPLPALLVGAEGIVAWANAALGALLEARVAEIVGLAILDLVHGEDADRARQFLSDALRSPGVARRCELRVRHRGEAWRTVDATAVGRLGDSALEGVLLGLCDVGERRAAEHALRESESRHRALVEALNDDALFLLDGDGRVVSWNPGSEKLHGYRADEILGRPLELLYEDDDRAARRPADLLRRARELSTAEDEGWRLRKDGTRFWALVNASARRDAAGALRGYAVLARDISRRRRADQALKESEERFRLLVDGVRDCAIVMLDGDGRIATWNAGAERLFGYSATGALGRHVEQLFGIEARESGVPRRLLDRARADERVADEGWHERKDGTHFWGEVSLTALRDERGRARAFIAVTRDISETRRASLVLRESEERFRQLAENVEAMFWIRECMDDSDLHPKFLYVSRAWETISGRSRDSLFANPETMTQAILPEDRDEVRAARLQSNETPCEVEFRLRRADGAIRWIRGRSFPIRNADGRVYRVAGISEDVTERKNAEESLQQFFALSMDLLCIARFDGYFIKLSRGWTEALGWSSDELRSRPFIEFVHPEDREGTVAEADKLVAGEPSVNFENRYATKDGGWRWLLWSATTSAEKRLFYAVARDITDRKRAEDLLRHGASYDPLTDLPNRNALNDRLGRLLARTQHDPEYCIAVLYLDLDGFKAVNDSFGHATGDVLLTAVARRLEAAVRPGDFISRLGGDEFVVVLEDVKDGQVAQAVCERIGHAFAEPFQIEGRELATGVSAGIAISNPGHERPLDIMRDADAQMYREKATRKESRKKA